MPSFHRLIATSLVLFACVIGLLGGWLPATPTAIAASSAAIRAFDDVDISGKDFAGQNLIRAEFANVKLTDADFSNADLRGAVFNGSELRGANFHGADFSNGIGYLSNFAEADLTNAIFDSAMLLQSNFRDADITGADFSFALLDREQVIALCKTASGTNPKTGVSTRASLEC